MGLTTTFWVLHRFFFFSDSVFSLLDPYEDPTDTTYFPPRKSKKSRPGRVRFSGSLSAKPKPAFVRPRDSKGRFVSLQSKSKPPLVISMLRLDKHCLNLFLIQSLASWKRLASMNSPPSHCRLLPLFTKLRWIPAILIWRKPPVTLFLILYWHPQKRLFPSLFIFPTRLQLTSPLLAHQSWGLTLHSSYSVYTYAPWRSSSSI
jgi:hypothetical protein